MKLNQIITILIITIVLVGSAYFANQYSLPISKFNISTADIDTTNWKTYTDDESNLSIQYPSSFQLEHGKNGELFFNDLHGKSVEIYTSIESRSLRQLVQEKKKQAFKDNPVVSFKTSVGDVTAAGLYNGMEVMVVNDGRLYDFYLDASQPIMVKMLETVEFIEG